VNRGTLNLVHAARLLIAVAAFFSSTLPAYAIELITKQEASLPSGDPIELRGPLPGPSIEVVWPSLDIPQKAPIRVLIRFKTYGTPVDTESVRIIYVKDPLIELTQRVHDFIAPAGIELAEAEVPSGIHTIHIQLKDTAGRVSALNFTFTVRQ
jgi:hypothetical protein